MLRASEHLTRVVLRPFDPSERVEDLDLAPPAVPAPDPVPVSPEAREKNERRLAEENRLREAYVATFPSEAAGAGLARELGLDPEVLWPLIRKSQGNWRHIDGFLRGLPAKRRSWGLLLLGTLSDKDLRDTPAVVLRHHLDHVLGGKRERAAADRDLFVAYVLAPRIAHELLRPWRGYLQRTFGSPFMARVRKDPRNAVAWVRENLRIEEEANYYGVPLSPRGVHELRVADRLSRDVFFVALCRAAGVPARLEPATSRPQFHQEGGWRSVRWDDGPPAEAPTGKLSLSGKPETPPEYSVHFALARFEGGRYETLDFEGKPWSFFQQPFELPAGDYVLTTGYRRADGSVLARQRYFALKPGETRAVPLEIRTPERHEEPS
jgi:hypothetical protein